MSESFNLTLDSAIKRCEGRIVVDDALKNGFYRIYPFTTENISGYINKFNLDNKSLLTVGSSGDQVINAILNGCRDITVLDLNPYTKFYYYLKVSSILNLNLEEFLKFLRFKDFPKVFKDNHDVFDKKLYDKVKSTLRLLDYESYLFWDELFQTFNPIDIRNNLFSFDENRTYVILECNPYLQNPILYYYMRDIITKINVDFITSDLFKIDLDKNFDNIWLSNIGTRLSMSFIKIMVDKVSENLNTNGKLLICYLYKTTINTRYQIGWNPIYDLDETLNILDKCYPSLFSFVGVDGLKFHDDDIKDSVLVYKKQ